MVLMVTSSWAITSWTWFWLFVLILLEWLYIFHYVFHPYIRYDDNKAKVNKYIFWIALTIFVLIFLFWGFPELIHAYSNDNGYWGDYESNIIGVIVTVIIFVLTLIKQHYSDVKSIRMFSHRQIRQENLTSFKDSIKLLTSTIEFQSEISHLDYRFINSTNISKIKSLHNKYEKLHLEYVVNRQLSTQLHVFYSIGTTNMNKYCTQIKNNLIDYKNILSMVNKYMQIFIQNLNQMDTLSLSLKGMFKLNESEQRHGMLSDRFKLLSNSLDDQVQSLLNICWCLKIVQKIDDYLFEPTRVHYNRLIQSIKNLKSNIKNIE